MKQVLFVDDEPMILDGLKRLLRPMRQEWDMHFEADPAAALQRIENEDFDVVVSDMRMPVVNGVQVLAHAREHCPNAVRIGLSGYAEAEIALEAAQVTHQFLSKPCEAADIVDTVNRVVRLQASLNNPDLLRNISALSSLPSMPHLYNEIMREAGSPDGSLHNVGKIIGQDLAMSAKVLQLVNSAYFGLKAKVRTPEQAASVLGLDSIRTIVLSVGLFESCLNEGAAAELDSLWRHSTAVGALSKIVAKHLQFSDKNVELSMMAGMLHDVGKLIRITQFSQENGLIQGLMSKAQSNEIQAERELLGCTHMDIGAYLLTLWGFSVDVVEALAYHHEPMSSAANEPSVLTAVHIANELEHVGRDPALLQGRLCSEYLTRIGVELDIDALGQEISLSLN